MKNHHFIFALFISFALLSGCGDSTPKTPAPQEYYGTWEGQDGSLIKIYANGKGDFKRGGSSVEGGTVDYNAAKKTLTISFVGIGETWAIDEAPTASANTMKLSGMAYRRAGGFAPDGRDAIQVPSDEELQKMVKATLTEFSAAVEANNFKAFHATCGSAFQNQFTPEKLKEVFASFVKQKVVFAAAIAPLGATFSGKPSFDENHFLNVNGFYPTEPSQVKFEVSFVWEDDKWKCVGVNVNVEKAKS
jgi:hypothetical protein